MNIKRINILTFRYFILLLFAVSLSCNHNSIPNLVSSKIESIPAIKPDYSGITIPVNIAPLNFLIDETAESFYVKVIGKNGTTLSNSSRNGTVIFSEKKWKNFLESNRNNPIEYQVFIKMSGEWKQFNSFTNYVSEFTIDPFLYYRLLYPGYESWTEISIMQRNMESFDEKVVVENNVVSQNCVNCHSFNQQNPDNFMFHMRGSMGGTYFISDGDLIKFNLKTKEMQNGAVYPRWHPSGKYVAFSSNKVVQQFHSKASKKIEVSDLNSSMVLYEVQKNEMMQILVDINGEFMDTYPEWSPDGKWIYFCRAAQIAKEYDYRETKYNLCRVEFNSETRKFVKVELIFNAAAEGKSVSFPRVSPDGKSLVFTYHNYGCFPIWHKEADLYSIDLKSLKVSKLGVNSGFTESYHSWSSNGRWLVFSSKRGDGLTARPYIAFIDEKGNAQKPFVLPQENPYFYKQFIKTFNIPEFAKTDVTFNPGTIRKAANREAIQAKWINN